MNTPLNGYVKYLNTITRFVTRSPRKILVFVLFSTALVSLYAGINFKIDSTRRNLIDSHAPFRQSYDAFLKTFPVFRKTIIVAVEAQSGFETAEATRKLYDRLRKRTDLFASVFSPSADAFFRDHALLYLSKDQLEGVIDQLVDAQPALSTIASDPTLRGLFSLLESAVEAHEKGEALPPAFVKLMDQVSDTGDRLLKGEPGNLEWSDFFAEGDFGPTLQIIVIQAREDFTHLISGASAIAAIRQAAVNLKLTPENGVSVTLTGNVPLAYEEMRAVGQSVGLAGFLSTVFLAIILGFGIRSLRIIIAILITLTVGLAWTLGWAMASVGALNLVSATFAVLIIGLGVDFAVHLALRYQEAIEDGDSNIQALNVASVSTGGAVSICALTSAIGFLSFIPTRYRGVADLGVIAGGGMIIALVASFVVLTALLAVFGPPTGRAAGAAFIEATGKLFHRIGHHARLVSLVALVVMAGSASIAVRAQFNFSTLSLKNQDSESIRTLKKLQDAGIVTDYAVNIVAPNMAAVPDIERRLRALKTVKDVKAPDSYVPKDQKFKLGLLEEATLMLWPALSAEPDKQGLTPAQRLAATNGLMDTLSSMTFRPEDQALRQSAERLYGVLNAITHKAGAREALKELEQRLTANVNQPLDFLRVALQVNAVTFNDLPQSVRSRVVSKDGRVRIVGLPREDMTDFKAMKRFVREVTNEFPQATGRPILEAAVGEIVVQSFVTAIAIALTAIILVLLLSVRRVSDTLIILVPLVMASCLTIATSVIIGIPLNQANIIVLPLVMGLGVDNGIHMVLRFREDGSMENLLKSSTPRAIVLSTLTTVAAFGALSLSIHQGIRSMGLLLTISMGYLLVCTIFVLPALLYWRAGTFGAASRPEHSTVS